MITEEAFNCEDMATDTSISLYSKTKLKKKFTNSILVDIVKSNSTENRETSICWIMFLFDINFTNSEFDYELLL